MDRFVVGISGASGVILGIRTAEALVRKGSKVHLVVTDAAYRTIAEELGLFEVQFSHELQDKIEIHEIGDIAASIASGTYRHAGMVVVPCSMASLAAISLGLADTLLRRAADVTLKERRRLVLVPREMPFSSLHLEHMTRLSNMGAVIMPPQPAWYYKPRSIEDIEEYIVGRILAALGVENDLVEWKGS